MPAGHLLKKFPPSVPFIHYVRGTLAARKNRESAIDKLSLRFILQFMETVRLYVPGFVALHKEFLHFNLALLFWYNLVCSLIQRI